MTRPAHWFKKEVFKTSQVETGPVRRCSKSRRPGQQVFKSHQWVELGYPDPTRPDPTRPDPTRPDPTPPDPTRETPRKKMIVDNTNHAAIPPHPQRPTCPQTSKLSREGITIPRSPYNHPPKSRPPSVSRGPHPLMRLLEHLMALRAWCTRCLPGRSKTRHAPSRYCGDARVNSLTTTAMREMSTLPLHDFPYAPSEAHTRGNATRACPSTIYHNQTFRYAPSLAIA